MKTINDFISETCSHRRARKEALRDERILDTYTKYPELERIDEFVFKIRRTNIIKMLEELTDPANVVNEEVNELNTKRANFIKDHGIDPKFDELQPECPKCNDTGYIQKKSLSVVCSCMGEELIDAYNAAGLKDFDSVVPKNFKVDYIKNFAARRDVVHKKLVNILSSIAEGKKHSTYVYSDGVQTGKTYLSVVITKIAITLGLSAAYIKCEDLQTMTPEDVEEFKRIKLLIIDDYIGATTRSRYLAYNLNVILEARENLGYATVVVSNETKIEIVQNSDERIAGKLSRAREI